MLMLGRVSALLLVPLALIAAPSRATAQSSTDEALNRAIALYEKLDVELAMVILRRVISPSSPFEVSREQRVRAYTYLGATLAILGQSDSAVVYFRAALERDPFVDLDAARFTPQEQRALAEAKRLSFATAARPLVSTRWDPARDQVTFSAVTTHSAALRVEIQPANGGTPAVLYDREGDGIREVTWNGMIGPRLAAPGMYELRVIGRSLLGGRVDSASASFTLRHEFPTLEDTLPDLSSNDLLPERHAPKAGRSALLKGMAVAAVTILIPRLAGNSELRDGGSGIAATAAGTAAGAGVAAFLIRRRRPEIAANIAINDRRRALRAAENAAIASRNADRIAATRLELIPTVAR
jgi:tetratricopeptide (TPR) repeat protein